MRRPRPHSGGAKDGEVKEHHWSGWPGAFCLDCGTEDPMEIAIATNYFDPYKGKWGDSEEAQKLREIYELDKATGCPLKPPLLVRYAPPKGEPK